MSAQFSRRFAALLLAMLAILATWPATANPRLLVDMDTGEVLFAEEAGQPWHPASLTKLMTAYMTFAAIKAGRQRSNDFEPGGRPQVRSGRLRALDQRWNSVRRGSGSGASSSSIVTMPSMRKLR